MDSEIDEVDIFRLLKMKGIRNRSLLNLLGLIYDAVHETPLRESIRKTGHPYRVGNRTYWSGNYILAISAEMIRNQLGCSLRTAYDYHKTLQGIGQLLRKI
jgi:hypothetical protein